jgi:hypothetical protein
MQKVFFLDIVQCQKYENIQKYTFHTLAVTTSRQVVITASLHGWGSRLDYW